MNPTESTRRSWQTLTRDARSAPPPGDLDVRCSLRQAIEAEGTRSVRSEAPGGELLGELAALAQLGWMRATLAVLALGLAWSGWHSVDAVAELAFVLDLEGLILTIL